MNDGTIQRRKEPIKKVEGYPFNRYSDDPLTWMDFSFVRPGEIIPFDKDFWLKEMNCHDFFFNLDELCPYFTPPIKKSGLTGKWYDHSERLAPFITTELAADEMHYGSFIGADLYDGLTAGITGAALTYVAPVAVGGFKAVAGSAVKGLLKKAGLVGLLLSIGVPLCKFIFRGDLGNKLDLMLKSFISSTVGCSKDKFLRKIHKERELLTPFELSIIMTLQQFGFAFVDLNNVFIAVIYDYDALENAENLTEMREACALHVFGSDNGKGGQGGKYL